jgi:hypothetical protein
VPSSSPSHSLSTFPSSSLSFHYIPSSIPSIALDIQHFLQLFKVFWWDAPLCCYNPHWLNTACILLGLSTNLNPWRFTLFSTHVVSGVNNFKYVCSSFLCCVCGLVRVQGSIYGFQYVDCSRFYFWVL